MAASPLLLLPHLVLRAAPLDAVAVAGKRLALDGTLGRALQLVTNSPVLPDSKYIRAVVNRLLPFLALDESSADPLYELVARVTATADDTGGGVLTYFIDDAHPLRPDAGGSADELSGGVHVWESRFLSDIATRVWPAAFDLARALAALLGQPPSSDAGFGLARQFLVPDGSDAPAVLIELGAGTGLASLLAARALQQVRQAGPMPQLERLLNVVATDGDRAGVLRCSHNILRNAGWLHCSEDSALNLSAAVLDWSSVTCTCGGCDSKVCEAGSAQLDAAEEPLLGDSADAVPPMPHLDASLWSRASLLCGSDLVYGHDAIEPLARVLCAFLSCGRGGGRGGSGRGGSEATSDAEPRGSLAGEGAAESNGVPLPPLRAVEGVDADLVFGALVGPEGGRLMSCRCESGCPADDGDLRSASASEPVAPGPAHEERGARHGCPRASSSAAAGLPRLALLSTTRRTQETYGLFVAALAHHGLAYVDVTEALERRLRAGGWGVPLVDLRGEAPGEAAPALRGDVRTAVVLPEPAVRWVLSGRRG